MYKQIKDAFGNLYTNQIKRLSDNAVIPFAPDNTDYQAFLKWKEEGNEPLPAEE